MLFVTIVFLLNMLPGIIIIDRAGEDMPELEAMPLVSMALAAWNTLTLASDLVTRS